MIKKEAEPLDVTIEQIRNTKIFGNHAQDYLLFNMIDEFIWNTDAPVSEKVEAIRKEDQAMGIKPGDPDYLTGTDEQILEQYNTLMEPYRTEGAVLGDVTDRCESTSTKDPADEEIAKGGTVEGLDSAKQDILDILGKQPNRKMEKNSLIKLFYNWDGGREAFLEAFSALENEGKIHIQDDPTTKREMVQSIASLRQTYEMFNKVREAQNLKVASLILNKVAKKELIQVQDVTDEERTVVASLTDMVNTYFYPSEYLEQTAGFFTYDWDEGSPWKIEEEAGAKRLTRVVSTTQKPSIVSSIYRPGQLLVCISGLYPYPCVIREAYGNERYKVQSKLDGKMYQVTYDDLVEDQN